MKRIASIVLILALCLTASVGAWAEKLEENLDLAALRKYERVNSLCWVDDTLYILGDEGLYTWHQDSGASMLIDMKAVAPLRYMEFPPANAESEWEKAVHAIFTDGNKLYTLHYFSGSICVLEGQSLMPWHTFPAEQLFTKDNNRSFRGINDIVWVGNKLYLLMGSDDPEQREKTSLLAFDPETEQTSIINVDNVQQISIAPDNRLLFTRAVGIETDKPSLEVSYYDPATEKEEGMASLEVADPQAGVLFDVVQDSLTYCAGEDIMQRAVDGTLHSKGTLPLSMGGLSARAQLSSGGLFAGAAGQYVFLRSIDGAASPQKLELRIMGDINPDTVVQFSIANPDITVRTTAIDRSQNLQLTILSAGATVDLYVVQSPGPFAAMREKGFLHPLSENAMLLDRAKQVYPAIQEALFAGDKLMGIPINLQAYSWTLNQTLWDELDLGNIPTTYPMLLEGLARWEDEYADDYPEYKFLDMDQDVAGFVSAIVREYILQSERPDTPLTFDTSIFRETIQAVADNRHFILDNAERDGLPIIFTYSMGFGVISADGQKMVMMLPPKLVNDGQQSLAASMEVLVINPASEHKQEAVKFAEYVSEKMDIPQQYMLIPALTEAVRSSSYEENAAKLDNDIAKLEEQAQTVPADKKAAMVEALEAKKIQRENLENFAWLISPESVTCYRELAQNLRVPYTSLFLSDEITSGMASLEPIIQKYCAQELSPAAIDAFIREMDSVAKMIYQEAR